MPELLPTRAQQIGCKPRVLRARTVRALNEIRKRIERLAVPYEDIDSNIELYKQELLAKFDEFEQHIKDAQEWLEETAEY